MNHSDTSDIDTQLRAMAKSDGYDARKLMDDGEVNRLIHLANKHGRDKTQAAIDVLKAKSDELDLIRFGQGDHIKTNLTTGELLIGLAIVAGVLGFAVYELVQMFGGA